MKVIRCFLLHRQCTFFLFSTDTHPSPSTRQAPQQTFDRRDENSEGTKCKSSVKMKMKMKRKKKRNQNEDEGATPDTDPSQRHGRGQQQQQKQQQRGYINNTTSTTSPPIFTHSSTSDKELSAACTENEQHKQDHHNKNRRKWMNESQINNRSPTRLSITLPSASSFTRFRRWLWSTERFSYVQKCAKGKNKRR